MKQDDKLVRVILPAFLFGKLGGYSEFEVYGKTIRDIILELNKKYPDLKDRLLDGERINPLLCVLLDGKVVSADLTLYKILRDGSVVTIIQAIAGG